MDVKSMQGIINAAPDKCPITGLDKCTSYIFDEGVVYLSHPAYDAYTLPEYNRDDLSFSRSRIDMDDDFTRYNEYLCDLVDLLKRKDFDNIRAFYSITDDEISKAKGV